ncbi:MAG: NAD(P)/FAD-dependent oxidoreductase [Dehalococcoidales bacterium]|nr:NAD(P)/FAD-dependent oxidoreductase [Dehalococcoidales bacterium]
MAEKLMKLESVSRVAIAGGGPAGAFCAMYLRMFGEQNGIHPEITIYQNRDFSERGPKGCKGCAGILSAALLDNLEELDLSLPEDVIRNRLTAYNMHSPYTSISINKPASEKAIVTVYRGGGPRESTETGPRGFDDWLLSEAEDRGINIVRRQVSAINLQEGPSITVDGEDLEYDLVIMASGLTGNIKINGLNYIPPQYQSMAVGELYAGEDRVRSALGNTAHGFLIPQLGIVFGGLIPKGPFITVTVLSKTGQPVKIEDFLTYNIVRDVLPEHYERICGCRPKAVSGYARNFIADRFIAVGDSAVSKLYQDGINSAHTTARQAAYTAVFKGIAGDDFRKNFMPVFTGIKRDNLWGHILFSMNHKAKDSRTFLMAQYSLTGIEQNNTRKPQPFTRAAWGMLTGSTDYGQLLKGLMKPVPVVRLIRELMKESLQGMVKKEKSKPRKLYVGGRKVIILGSGFAGITALRRLVPKLNRNENVDTTMISNENYFLFTPLLHEVALGRIDARNIAYPVRSLNWRDRFTFVQSEVKKIDLKSKTVYTGSKAYEYDYLVIAPGSDSNQSFPGTGNKNVFSLKTLDDAIRIRNRIIHVFEQASMESEPEKQHELLTFVIAGAGYTGVQVVTGLCDLLNRMPKYYKSINREDIRIILVEKAPRIVSELHTKIGVYVMDYLVKHGIDVRLQSRITDITGSGIELNNNEVIPARTVIWVPGVAVNPLIKTLNVQKDNNGQLLVTDYLELPDAPGVFAAGDCIHFRNALTGKPLPPLARTAVSQAKIIAGNILADIRGTERKAFKYFRYWDVVNLGSYKAVFRFRFIRLYGVLPRLLLMIVYLFLISGTQNRIHIVIDWIMSMIFGRDTTCLRDTGNELKK